MPVRRALLLFALALAPSSASAATCAGADTPLAETSPSSARAAVLCIVNAERAARGLPTLSANDKLALAAQRHTDDMVKRDYFAHDAPDGSSPGDRITAAGYDWWSFGENIAAGYRTPRSVMTGWMASEGHCENVLDPGFTQLGVGVAIAPRGIGTWTQEFGRPRGTAAPSSDTGPQADCPFAGLAGIDSAGAVVAPVVDAPAGEEAGQTSAPTAGQTPAPAALRVRLRRVHHGFVIAGTLLAADRTRVRVAIVQRGRVVARGTARLRSGRFAIRYRTRRPHRLIVVVRAGRHRVVRAVR